VKFLNESPCDLLLYDRLSEDLLHELKAANASNRPARVGLPMDAVDRPQDLDVVPPEGHPHLPPSRQPLLQQSVWPTRP
jgi:hypothetical protein